ncbi:hypothetical protein JCM5350_005201 [Sporobolomyces pararoseus]
MEDTLMHQQRILDRLIELVQTPPDSESIGKISGLLDQLTDKSEWINRPHLNAPVEPMNDDTASPLPSYSTAHSPHPSRLSPPPSPLESKSFALSSKNPLPSPHAQLPLHPPSHLPHRPILAPQQATNGSHPNESSSSSFNNPSTIFSPRIKLYLPLPPHTTQSQLSDYLSNSLDLLVPNSSSSSSQFKIDCFKPNNQRLSQNSRPFAFFTISTDFWESGELRDRVERAENRGDWFRERRNGKVWNLRFCVAKDVDPAVASGRGRSRQKGDGRNRAVDGEKWSYERRVTQKEQGELIAEQEMRKGGTLKTLRRNLAEEGDFLEVANEAQEILDLDPLSVVGGGGGVGKVKVAIAVTVAGRRKTILVRRGGKGGGWIVLVLVLALGHVRLMVNIAIFTLKTLEDHLNLPDLRGIEKIKVELAHFLPLLRLKEKDPASSTTTQDQTYSNRIPSPSFLFGTPSPSPVPDEQQLHQHSHISQHQPEDSEIYPPLRPSVAFPLPPPAHIVNFPRNYTRLPNYYPPPVPPVPPQPPVYPDPPSATQNLEERGRELYERYSFERRRETMNGGEQDCREGGMERYYQEVLKRKGEGREFKNCW